MLAKKRKGRWHRSIRPHLSITLVYLALGACGCGFGGGGGGGGSNLGNSMSGSTAHKLVMLQHVFSGLTYENAAALDFERELENARRRGLLTKADVPDARLDDWGRRIEFRVKSTDGVDKVFVYSNGPDGKYDDFNGDDVFMQVVNTRGAQKRGAQKDRHLLDEEGEIGTGAILLRWPRHGQPQAIATAALRSACA